MSITVEKLKQYLAQLEASRSQLQANLQAQNGAIQFCQTLIDEIETQDKGAK